jgi:hypothetical protein
MRVWEANRRCVAGERLDGSAKEVNERLLLGFLAVALQRNNIPTYTSHARAQHVERLRTNKKTKGYECRYRPIS